ncbi:uncharacterized protein LOC113555706 [Rhopalosiphum maidis]|uniref:uncharacterized protein LOC113555706 n=1 Tax=Rhopalosiphum maidis TaxID=43146 RepID=UPI000EFE0C9D|nr:uncharacterized protein LOC113555706 [Rhopalosiphum maidis]
MKCFNYNFLCVPSFTLEFGVAVLTAVFTILTLVIVVVNVSELSKNLIVLGSIFLLLLTWAISFTGALLRSRKLIAFTIVIWTIFIIEWLVLSLYFRIYMQNVSYCVAQKTKCATTMWLMSGEKNCSDSSDVIMLTNFKDSDDSKNNETESDTETETEPSRRLWSINDSPEITVKTFHPMRTNVIPSTVAVTSAADTVVSNKTRMTVGINNGCGCEHHPRTTTESPPSDLITRVIEYRKNMTMYRQTSEAVIQRKKKDGKKNKVSDEEYDGDNYIGRGHHKKKDRRRKTDGEDGDEEAADDSEGDGDDTSKNDDTEEKSDEPGNTAKCSLIDYVVMAVFLILYSYALFVLLCYHNELKLMQNCKCTYLT